MERPKCGICSKVFSNCRALGGHLRSHLATLPLPPKTEPQQHSANSSFCNSTSSSLEEKEKDLVCGLREKPKRSFKLGDPELGVQDRESETDEAETAELTRNPTRKRSKRSRKLVLALQAEVIKKAKPEPGPAELVTELEPVLSSVSHTSPEEDVAMCLIMLSRDVWTSGSDDSVELKPIRTRGKYQCETCKKVFKSFQALGGHRTSHKKIKNCFQENHEGGKKNAGVKSHKCPFCHKEFKSGQALGGHKRSHIMNSSTTTTTPASSVKQGGSLVNSTKSMDHLSLDLNLPAPVEEEFCFDDEDFLEVDFYSLILSSQSIKAVLTPAS